ncbi:MAG TPA: carbonic anhydrase [Gemmatimonadales bacterium]|nr:carbonic anhydrase [Gemmatimonadales bacterium]
MKELAHLFENNRRWARDMTARDPEFFRRLAGIQAPRYVWIGCSDSRVPANTIVGLLPGEVFVHRNVANLVTPGDANCLSVLQFAVETLGVEHIIVCGHHGCGGVRAALSRTPLADPIARWLEPLVALAGRYAAELGGLGDEEARVDRLCELNVRAQVGNVCRTEIVRRAWARGRSLAVHGWYYDLRDGLLRDLGLCVRQEADLPADLP